MRRSSPMLATTGALPAGPGWSYEFKWDGVRVLADAATAAPHGSTPVPARRSPPRTRSWLPLAERGRRTERCSTARWWCSTRPDGPRSPPRRADARAGPARAARLAATLPGHLHDLRPAAVRRRRPDRAALPRAAGGARRPRPGRDRAGWCRRPSPTGRRPAPPPGRTRPGGRGRQTARHGLPARGPLSRLDQGQVRPYRRLRHRRLAARRAAARRAAGRRARTGRAADLPGPGRRRHRRRQRTGPAAPRSARCAADRSPFAGGRAPRGRPGRPSGYDPQLVVEVQYGNRTPDGRLRFPRFLRLRPDKTPGSAARRTTMARSRFAVQVDGRDLGAVQPGQGALPGGRVHQGRGDRLLHPDRAGAAAAPARPGADPDPLPQRRRRRALLREERTRRHPRLGTPGDAAGPRLDEGPGDHRLRGRRRPAHPGLAGQPRRARAAHPAVADRRTTRT